MSWKRLLAQRKLHQHRTSEQELDALRALIQRDLTDAALTGLSADRRFATAYNTFVEQWISSEKTSLAKSARHCMEHGCAPCRNRTYNPVIKSVLLSPCFMISSGPLSPF